MTCGAYHIPLVSADPQVAAALPNACCTQRTPERSGHRPHWRLLDGRCLTVSRMSHRRARAQGSQWTGEPRHRSARRTPSRAKVTVPSGRDTVLRVCSLACRGQNGHHHSQDTLWKLPSAPPRRRQGRYIRDELTAYFRQSFTFSYYVHNVPRNILHYEDLYHFRYYPRFRGNNGYSPKLQLRVSFRMSRKLYSSRDQVRYGL